MLEDDGCVATGAGVGGMTFTGTEVIAGFDFPLGVRSNVLPRTVVCCVSCCGAAIFLFQFSLNILHIRVSVTLNLSFSGIYRVTIQVVS